MSKRHNASRRRAYGRRRHELRERQEREGRSPSQQFDLETWGSASHADPLAFLDPRGQRVRYAMGE
jgi:hypothetical protein